MAKFKKGDRVRIAIQVPDHWSVGRMYGVGAKGTVLENDSSYPDIRWDDDDDIRCCPENCLKLIEHQPDRMAELEARVAELERAILQVLQP